MDMFTFSYRSSLLRVHCCTLVTTYTMEVHNGDYMKVKEFSNTTLRRVQTKPTSCNIVGSTVLHDVGH